MARWARVEGNTVKEIIPLETMEDIIKYYGGGQETAFTRSCVEVTGKVEVHWTFDPETKKFSPPAPVEDMPPPDSIEGLTARLAALEEKTEKQETQISTLQAEITSRAKGV